MPNEREIAATLMGDASRIISTERGQQHGDLEGSFTLIAEWWNSYVRHKMTTTDANHCNLDAVDVLEMMAMVKKARNVYGSSIPDHTVDDIGYTGLAGGLRLRDKINERVQQEVGEAMKKAMEGGAADDGAPIPQFLKDRKPFETDDDMTPLKEE